MSAVEALKSGSNRFAWLRFEFAVFVIAFLARLLVPLTSTGGIKGAYDYDPSVYYAAADAMVHGHLPYRGFYFVHPPLQPILLTPFAVLGRLTSAPTGFLVANLFAIVLGSVNAVLVMRLLRQWQLPVSAAGVGGLFYALWSGSTFAEFTVRLEPFGNFFFLMALIAFSHRRHGASARWAFLGGAALCLAVSVKIWWALPLVVVLVGQAVAAKSLRRLAPALVGVVTVGVVVDLPFLFLSHGRMWTMLVATQFGRPRRHGAVLHRVGELISGSASPMGGPLLVLLAVTALAAAVLAWRVAAVRVLIVLTILQVLMILATPSAYAFYADFLAVGFAAIVGAACAQLVALLPNVIGRSVGLIPALLALSITSWQAADSGSQYIGRLHVTAADQTVAARYRCITADSPMALIALNALDRSFEAPCHDWVDVTSPALGAAGSKYKLDGVHPNPAWTRLIESYLDSGSATMFVQTVSIGVSPTWRQALLHRPIAFTVSGHPLYVNQHR